MPATFKQRLLDGHALIASMARSYKSCDAFAWKCRY
jgi:hypothetical protein